MLSITYRETTYLVPAFPHEVTEHHHARAWFIARKQPKTEEEFDYWTRMSRFYINWYVFGCEYEDKIMKELE